jgi:hypothetical protein
LMLVMGMAQGQTNFLPPVSNPFSYSPGGSASWQAVSAVDLDGDGDTDVMIADDNGGFRYYENTGNSTVPSFAVPITNPFGLSGLRPFSCYFTDLDNDGDFDVLASTVVTGQSGIRTQFIENTGTATNPAFGTPVSSPFGINTQNYDLHFATADFDNDGDLDLLIGNELNGNFNYFENTGTASAPAFGPGQSNPYGLTSSSRMVVPVIDDFDADGDLDILAGEWYGSFMYFENIGSQSSPRFNTSSANPFGLQAPPNIGHIGLAAADMDADGDVDLLMVDNVKNLHFFENSVATPPPPPVIQFSGNSLTVDEPTAGTISVAINITNPNGNATTAAVRLAGASNASLNSDFLFTDPTPITFPPNSTSPVSLSIPILDDNWVEPDETIILELISPGNNASFGPDSVFTITIRSEDFVAIPPSINFTSEGASLSEASGSYEISAQLTSPVSQQVEVTVASGPLSTALFGQDYTLSSNRFVFPPNSTAAQSITVNLINDPDDEMDELLSLRMINPIGGVPLGDTTTFNLEILDDDYAVGLEQLEAELGLRVSPNPASSFVDIRLNQAARLHCSLMDMRGKTVLEQDLSGMLTRLDLAGLSAGVYLLRIASGERSGSLKLIIR